MLVCVCVCERVCVCVFELTRDESYGQLLPLTLEHLPDESWSTEIGRLWNCTSAKQVLQAVCGTLQVVDVVFMGKCFVRTRHQQGTVSL